MSDKLPQPRGRPPLDPKIVEEIVNRYLNLETESETATRLGIHEHTVLNKLKEEREKRPDLERLRRLNKELIGGKVLVLDSMRAARTLGRFEEHGVKPKTKDLAAAETLLDRYGSHVTNAIGAGEWILGLEEREGTSFEVLQAEAERLHDQIKDGMEQYGKLGDQLDDRRKEFGKLSDYEEVKAWLTPFKTNAHEMTEFIARNRTLDSLDFTKEAAVSIATELKKKDLSPEEAAKELAEAIDTYKTLGAAIRERERTKKHMDDEIDDRKAESGRIGLRNTAAKEQVIALETTVGNLRLTVTTLNNTIKTAGENAKGSMDTIVSGAKTAIEGVKGTAVEEVSGTGTDLKGKIDASTKKFSEAATSVETLAKEAEKEMQEALRLAVDVGKQVQSLDPTVRALFFINQGKGEPSEVFPVVVPLLRNFLKWEDASVGKFYSTTSLQDAIKETERNWGRY